MSSDILAAVSPVSALIKEDFAAWEHLLLAEDDLVAAPPIPLDTMRRESLYGPNEDSYEL